MTQDSYLRLAEDVLRRIKRPLTALQILRAAYEMGIAPPHLHGRTQHKTLGARLSEDILRLRETSRFYRTAPGRFLLRELENDEHIPEEVRRPIVARRRKRMLPQRNILALDCDRISACDHAAHHYYKKSDIVSLIDAGSYHYLDSLRMGSTDLAVWTFSIVVRNNHILSYRQGTFREDRDHFHTRRTLGFYSPVIDVDLNLFEQADHGIVGNAIRTLIYDLDLYHHDLAQAVSVNSHLKEFIAPASEDGTRSLLALVAFSCPEWLDPTSTRLAINDLQWMDLHSLPNHHDDFDPWSRAVLHQALRLASQPA